ncbi:hypothetical protein Pa4123_75990 [Phytohabitans aurantiacus]|uniref:Uncharacterized protein n=1 Tax=Phytohabitans aurantiacus TaxID=3016789 RepID=A0ABQ5R6Z4_9ACTN|nr:hypothetical protein Pa4123_75990 [Phytohabitans aurantiacus]
MPPQAGVEAGEAVAGDASARPFRIPYPGRLLPPGYTIRRRRPCQPCATYKSKARSGVRPQRTPETPVYTMTKHVGAVADRLRAMVLPKTTASAVCKPGCTNTPLRHHPVQVAHCNSIRECWWGTEC